MSLLQKIVWRPSQNWVMRTSCYINTLFIYFYTRSEAMFISSVWLQIICPTWPILTFTIIYQRDVIDWNCIKYNWIEIIRSSQFLSQRQSKLGTADILNPNAQCFGFVIQNYSHEIRSNLASSYRRIALYYPSWRPYYIKRWS